MIRDEHNSERFDDADAKRALNRAHLCGERLEPSQRPLWFRQHIHAPIGLGANSLVNRRG
jgi:hypothetical protein